MSFYGKCHLSEKGTRNSCIPVNLQETNGLVTCKLSQMRKYSKTRVKRPLKNRQNKGINDNWYLMKVKSIAACSREWSF